MDNSVYQLFQQTHRVLIDMAEVEKIYNKILKWDEKREFIETLNMAKLIITNKKIREEYRLKGRESDVLQLIIDWPKFDELRKRWDNYNIFKYSSIINQQSDPSQEGFLGEFLEESPLEVPHEELLNSYPEVVNSHEELLTSHEEVVISHEEAVNKNARKPKKPGPSTSTGIKREDTAIREIINHRIRSNGSQNPVIRFEAIRVNSDKIGTTWIDQKVALADGVVALGLYLIKIRQERKRRFQNLMLNSQLIYSNMDEIIQIAMDYQPDH